MNRRAFLQRLAAAAAALPAYRAAALVRDFGVPDKALMFHRDAYAIHRLPSPSVRNMLLTPEQMARWVLEEFERQQRFLEGAKWND